MVAVSKKKERNRASALGFSLGYLGGGILFLINVIMFLYPNRFWIIFVPKSIIHFERASLIILLNDCSLRRTRNTPNNHFPIKSKYY